jgi:hypothetical protein
MFKNLAAKQIAPAIWDKISHKQWLSIWRMHPRCIHVRGSLDSRHVDISSDDLKKIEEQMYNTRKYCEAISEYLTVLTYSEVDNGALSLFEVVLEEKESVAAKIELVACMDEVPWNVLRELRKQVDQNKIDLRFKGPNFRRSCNGKQTLPYPAIVKTENTKLWSRSGWGWRRALRLIDCEVENKREGLTATIPQMMAFLHLGERFLTKGQSSSIMTIADPLKPLSDDLNESGAQLRREAKLLGPPDENPHVGSDVRVVVLFLLESDWVKEEISGYEGSMKSAAGGLR